MPKGVPNKRYTGEFKQMVVETLRREKLSYREAEEKFGVANNRIRIAIEYRPLYAIPSPSFAVFC